MEPTIDKIERHGPFRIVEVKVVRIEEGDDMEERPLIDRPVAVAPIPRRQAPRVSSFWAAS